MRAARHSALSTFRRHRRARTRKVLLCVAVTVAAFATPAGPPAQAAVPVLPGAATSLSDAFNSSGPSLAKALLCPLATGVQTVTSTVPGVATLTSEMANLLCALSVLGYAYRTTYYPPSGPPQVRYYRALAGVPTLLDVDGNGLPDFSGLVAPTLAPPGISVTVNRLAISSSARVKVEAVFLDPVDNGTWVGVGEDGSQAGTPGSWQASVGALLSSGSSVDLQLSLAAHSQPAALPASLATFGEVFFGTNPDAPTSTDFGSAGFTPVPNNFTTRLRIGPSSQTADVTTTVPTVLDAHVRVIKPGDEKDIDATVDKVPATMEITHSTDNGHELVTYDAGAPIDKITGSYHDKAGDAILTAAQVDITGLPSAFSLDQFDGKTVFNVPTGSIGNVEVRYATGQDVPASPAGSDPYVSFHRYSSSRLTAGLRLGNIQSVSFDSTGPYVGDVVFSTAPGLIPLSLVDDVSGVSATGHLSNLPAHLTVTIDLDAGKVVFDGHGTGIHEIAISATKSTGTFFTRASRIDLDVMDLPALDTITFKPSGGAASFQPSAPIGSVSLLASDGTGAPAVSGDYVSYEDTASRYRIYLQMNSVAGVSFDTSPTMTATLETGDPQSMTLFAHIADQPMTHDITFNGLIKNLPTRITVTADLDNGKVTYDANDTIDEIDVSARDAVGTFFGRVSRVAMTIKGLPQTNTITFQPSGKQVTFTPSSPIDSVALLASDGTDAPNVSGDFASYEDTPTMYRIYLQMLGIKGLSFTASPSMSGTIKTDSPQLMTLYGHVVQGTSDITLNGTIDKLPDWIDFSLTNGADSTIDYNTHGEAIDQITLDGAGLPLPYNADTVHAVIDHLPSHITATIPSAGGTAVFDPHGDHIGRVLVQAYPHGTGPHNSVAGHQTAYANLNTGQFTADIQNIGLTKFTTGTSGISLSYDVSSAPLDAEFDNDDGTYFKTQISNPEPASIVVNTDNRTQVSYTVNTASPNFTGSGEINEIDVQTNVAGGYLGASLQHIAPKLLICFDGGGSSACTPGFVPAPGHTFQDADGNNWLMPNSSFDFQVVPTALDGTAWPTRFRLDGTYCFDEPDAATCLDGGQQKQRIVISDLQFGKVAAGVGFQEDGCTACTAGRLYDYFDTDNTNISGDVKYYDAGEDDPFVEYHTDSPSDGIAAQNQFLFADYCAPLCLNDDELDLVHGGSFTCNGSPHLDINTFIDVDVLSGSLIHIC